MRMIELTVTDNDGSQKRVFINPRRILAVTENSDGHALVFLKLDYPQVTYLVKQPIGEIITKIDRELA